MQNCIVPSKQLAAELICLLLCEYYSGTIVPVNYLPAMQQFKTLAFFFQYLFSSGWCESDGGEVKGFS